MRAITSIFLLFLTQLLFAQQDQLLTKGFHNETEYGAQLSDGSWILAIRSIKNPGHVYQDSLRLLHLSSDGQVLGQTSEPFIPYEVHFYEFLTPTPDTGFIVELANQGCDFGTESGILRKYNKNGAVEWEIVRDDQSDLKLPYAMQGAPDGNLIATYYDGIRKLDLHTGAEIWHATYVNTPLYFTLYQFDLLPGTEHIGAVLGGYFYYLEQTQFGNGIAYVLNETAELPDYGYETHASKSPDFDGFYLLSNYDKAIYQKVPYQNANLVVDFLPEFWSATQDNQGFEIWFKSGSYSNLVRTDWSGNFLDTLLTVDNHYSNLHATPGNSKALVWGSYLSGNLNENAYFKTGMHSWSRVIANNSEAPALDYPDAALVAIDQMQPVTVDSFVVGVYKNYTLNGGNFRLQIRNQGPEVLQGIQLMTAFQPIMDICFFGQTEWVYYTGLNLNPGESMWLDLGDVLAYQLFELPENICFWVAAPNERPDANPADDYLCSSILLTDNEVSKHALKISPNPASDQITISDAQAGTLYQLVSAAGRILQTGTCMETETIVRVENLTSGMYYLRVGSKVEKIIIHPSFP